MLTIRVRKCFINESKQLILLTNIKSVKAVKIASTLPCSNNFYGFVFLFKSDIIGVIYKPIVFTI